MNILIMETCTKTENGIDAHLRNAIEIKKYLESKNHIVFLEFIDTLKYFDKKNIDCIIVSYASFYADFKNMKRIIEENKQAKLFWISNEYNLMPNGSLYKIFKERNADIIANFEKKSNDIKCFNNFYFLNLNLLLFDNEKRNINKKYDCIYYGTFREDRKIYFEKYLQKNVFLSTSEKNIKKFIDCNCNSKFIKKFSWEHKKETLNNFKYSLYIEDVHIHENFNNLANRFYEALKCNVVLFFDINCKNTIIKSNIEFDDYFYVKDYNELMSKIKNDNYEMSLRKQLKWKIEAEIQKNKMLKCFEEIITK